MFPDMQVLFMMVLPFKSKLDRWGRGRNLYLFLYYRRTDRKNRDRFKPDPDQLPSLMDDLCRSFRF